MLGHGLRSSPSSAAPPSIKSARASSFGATVVRPAWRPIHAALVAYDSLIVLDEVHLSNPFAETLDLIAGSGRPNPYLCWAKATSVRPLQTVELSATPGRTPAFVHTEKDSSHPILGPRVRNPKQAQLLPVDDKKLVSNLVRAAQDFAPANQPKVVGIIVNRVSTARAVFAELENKRKDASHLLLTGRIRPLDRDAIWSEWRDTIAAKPNRPAPPKTIFVVATQCVEAGTNIDFDALVTECASLDALRQRFGRLNRMGNHESATAKIVASKKEIELDADSAKDPHPVYGNALARTWKWINEKEDENGINFAHESLATLLPTGDDLLPLLPQKKEAPILLPAHLDFLCQTQPEPFPSPDVHYFLRGRESEPPQVSVLWRDLPVDLNPQDSEDWVEVVSLCRPSAMEMMQLPLHAVRAWLAGETTSSDFADVESGIATESKAEEPSPSFQACLRWFGEDASELATAPESVRPGDTIVVQAKFGGCDRWGWNPNFKETVADLSPGISRYLRGYTIAHLSALPASGEKARLLELFDEEERNLEAISSALRALSESCPSNSAPSTSFSWFAENPSKIDVWRLPSNGKLFALRSTKRVPVNAPEEDHPIHTNHYTFRRGKEIKLADHHLGVAEKAASFASLTGLNELIPFFERAGLTHDCGKADPRFQLLLRNGDMIKATSELLAKSSQASPRLRKTIESASGYPKGARHEFTSVALLHACGETDELFLHLMASHHGHARPLAPVVPDTSPVHVTYNFDDQQVSASSAHGLERIGSGVARRFWDLTRRYGWWGLAYLETILRLADHCQSEEEQQ